MPGRAAARSVRARVGRIAVAALVLLALGGCEVRTELNVTVEDDGSGRLELAVALDEEAMSRRPGLLENLDLGQLTDSGWEVTGPAEEADGATWIRARRDFASPGDLGALVDDIAGEGGPFRDFRLERGDGFAERRYRFAGTVDFTAGAGALTDDPELAEALEAESIELLEERLGAAIDEMVRVQVAVRMPGSVDSNALTQASNGAVWRPSVVGREPVELRATSTVSQTGRLAGLAVAGLAVFAVALYALIRVAAWNRSRRPSTTAGP